jgi:CPA2 family monovalent cation:H+ antiporter-2
MLSTQQIGYIAFEHDAALVTRLHAAGLPVHFGDAARAELLRKARADQAAAIVLTMDHPAATLNAVRGIRRELPSIPIFARSRDEQHALALMQAGATNVIPETLEASLQLSAFVLQTMGVADATAAQVIQRERERHLAALEQGRAG